MIAKDLMTTPVITIEETSTVETAARLMLDQDISSLPVLNRRRESGRDILTHSDFGLSPKFRPLMDNVFSLLGSTTTPRHLEETANKVGGKLVRDVMRRHVITASQDTDMEHIAQLMLRANIHRLPISGRRRPGGHNNPPRLSEADSGPGLAPPESRPAVSLCKAVCRGRERFRALPLPKSDGNILEKK